MVDWTHRIIALFLLLCLSPLLLLISLGIVLTDFGPILYLSKRAGKNGEPFTLCKFRTMRQTQNDSAKITKLHDERIFPFGKILRNLKFDELPQLFNIVKGEMSLVGPRPEDLSIVHHFYDNRMKKTLSVLPGLASPGSLFNYTHLESQLNSKNFEEYYLENTLQTKLEIDLVYVQHRSLAYDINIIFRTIKVIILKVMGKKNFSLPPECEFIELDENLKVISVNKSNYPT